MDWCLSLMLIIITNKTSCLHWLSVFSLHIVSFNPHHNSWIASLVHGKSKISTLLISGSSDISINLLQISTMSWGPQLRPYHTKALILNHYVIQPSSRSSTLHLKKINWKFFKKKKETRVRLFSLTKKVMTTYVIKHILSHPARL